MRIRLLVLAALAFPVVACTDDPVSPGPPGGIAAAASPFVAVSDIGITNVCSSLYVITNDNDAATTVRWTVAGSPNTGMITVPANDSVYVDVRSPNTVTLSYQGVPVGAAEYQGIACAPSNLDIITVENVCATTYRVVNANSAAPLPLSYTVDGSAEAGAFTLGPLDTVLVTTAATGLFRLYWDTGQIETASASGTACPVVKTVDVKPEDAGPAPVNMRARGVLPIAILSSRTFDATAIDVATVRIADVHLDVKPNGEYHYAYADVNADGYMDLLVFFRVEDLVQAGAISPTATDLTVIWTSDFGTETHGSDLIRVL